VLILDTHQTIEWMNWEAEACLGLHATADTGSRLTHLLREPELLNYLNNPGSHATHLILSTQRNPGRALQMQVVPFAAGRTLLMVRDVTQLEKLATMRRDFVANVSHELKTPLTVTLGFIETAADALGDATPDELAGYLRTAAEQAHRMQHLIEDLLTLSSLETDSPPLEDDDDLAVLLTAVREEAAALSGGRHPMTLEITGPSHLTGSSRELHSALGNLVTNAVRYTPPGGEIALRWDADANGGRFSVRDTGVGIAAEHLPRLTERFYRVDHGRSREMGGTGLGLAIVKHVLERHQAQLEIESELGKGSVFTAIFPEHRVH
jgi:two-component system phosphate regulon sensor histidine kinase PhoR